MKQTTVRFNEETLRQIKQLAAWVQLPTNTDVIRYAIAQAVVFEAARRALSDSDFVGFLAEVYRPLQVMPRRCGKGKMK